MAVHHGKNGKVKLSTNAVAEITKWSCKEGISTADTTAMGDAAETHLTGIPNWSASVEGNYDPADTNGQVALTIGASVTLGLYSDGDASGKTFRTGTASVTAINHEASMGDRVTFSVELLGNGALSISTVPA